MPPNIPMFVKSTCEINVIKGHRRHALSLQNLRITDIGSYTALIISFIIGSDTSHVSNNNLPVIPHATISAMNPTPCPSVCGRHILLSVDAHGLRGRVMSINTHRLETLLVPIYLRRRLWELTSIVPQR